VSIPVSTTIKLRNYNFPIVTWALIGLNVTAYIAIYISISIAIAPDLRQDPEEISRLYQDIYRLYGLTAQNPRLFNMFTSTFLHTGLFHLVTNMILLWLFGRSLERALGAVEYLMLYVGSGLVAAVTHLAIVALFMPGFEDQASVGASGAIAGVLGVYAIRFCRSKFGYLGVEVHSSLLLLVWLILQVFLGVLSLHVDSPGLERVDYWSHIGGFIFGMIIAQITNMARIGRKEYLLTDAQDSFRRGTLLDVVQKYEALLRYDADDAFTNAELGRTWALLEDTEQTVPYYQKAIDLYLKSGRGEEAVSRYQELLHLLPQASISADTLYKVGCYLEESGKPWKAINLLNKILSGHIGSVESEMAALKISQIQLRASRPELAVATLETFLNSHPNSEWQRFAEQTLESARHNAAQNLSPQDEPAE
jgi:membrane associated rhomboid family serine protease